MITDKQKRLKWDKTYREKNPDKIKVSAKNFRDTHKEKEKIRQRKKYLRYKEENPDIFKKWYKNHKDKPKAKYQGYKKNAKSRGIDFDITLEEFCEFWKKPCSYCGGDIEFIGIDRVDNNKGYTRGNLKSCCEWCNKMKMAHSENDFIDRCKKIATFCDRAI